MLQILPDQTEPGIDWLDRSSLYLLRFLASTKLPGYESLLQVKISARQMEVGGWKSSRLVNSDVSANLIQCVWPCRQDNLMCEGPLYSLYMPLSLL